MAEKKAATKILETRYFGLIIGLVVFLLLVLVSTGFPLLQPIELKMLDFNFRAKTITSSSQVQVGVSVTQGNPHISPDILIVGIDDRALGRFGRWPFPRYRHADLVNALARIKNQGDRERALFIDVFFSEPSEVPEDDALLVSAIRDNNRVFLETVLSRIENDSVNDAESYAREDVLSSHIGSFTNITGDWLKVTQFLGLEAPPLKPYAAATYRYGHANFLNDGDQVYRRQPLVARLSRVVKEIPLDDLSVSEPLDRTAFEHLAWFDNHNNVHEVPYPLTPAVLDELKKQVAASAPLKKEEATDTTPARSYYVVRKYHETFIPSITLSLALDYMHKTMSDAEVVLGKYVRIPDPQKFNVDTQQWEKYSLLATPAQVDKDGKVIKDAVYKPVSEIRIPIDETGSMLINFMGYPSSSNPDEHQTFPVRSYAGYAGTPSPPDPARWPNTKKLGNTIVMVGPFAKGMAADEKPTPFGLMYGVEMHANALNTILTGNFLTYAPPAVSTLILFLMIMVLSLFVSRLSTLWGLVVTFVVEVAYFLAFTLVFEFNNYILPFSGPALGCVLAVGAVIAYRTVFEERSKRRITSMFGKMVGPTIVKQMIDSGVEPELGGVDKELTVFFSDIRGFTTLSESLSPQALVNHLNEYLAAMTDLIIGYSGTLDKYVGDEIMCFWGAPKPEADHALLACKCAVKQMQVLEQMNKEWPPAKRLSIGIGLNTGIMTVGNMGSAGRMNYTVMGDNVNLGARLEGTNKQYSTSIIMSEYTYAQVKDKVIARELDTIKVKGKNKPVLIYELLDVLDGLEPPARVH